MKLPSLPDLGFLEDDDPKEEVDVKTKKTEEKKKVRKKRVESTSKDKKKKESRVPKTEYDNEGNPKLAIPDLDDVDLSNEIERILGDGG